MADSTPIVGRTISRYRILEEVGRGGMATVYRALDTGLGREVAVKVLHPHLAGEAESRSRLEREAQAVAKLRHDNILEIHDYSGQSSEAAESFIVTEFIRGPTLTGFLNQHKVTVPEVAAMIVHQLAAALETAHRAGVIHRDIKPENVMIRSDDGRVKLTDFGIAQIIDKERLTATGQLIGSPAYLAPELVEGGRVDFRTDVFSLGIVLYRVATGQLPFQGRNPHEMMKRIVECRYAPPDQENPAVGRGLARIIARALSRRPDDRYPDMESLRRDLEADLAPAGIDDVRAELGRYFAAPEAWEAAARPRLTATLVATAKREAARGHRAAALAAVARALGLSPGDAAARSLLERIGRRRRAGMMAGALAAGALVIGGGVVLQHRAAHRPPPPATGKGVAREAKSGPMVAGSGTQGAATPARPTPSPTTTDSKNRPPPPRLRPPPNNTPATREITLNVSSPTKALTLLVDNDVYPWDGNERRIRVTTGRPHRITLRNESFYDAECVVGDDDSTTPELRMKWKPARLRIFADPASAEITIEPEHRRGYRTVVGNAEVREIPIPNTARAFGDGKEVVYIEASAAGFESEKRTVTVRGGALTSETIKLIDLQKRP